MTMAINPKKFFSFMDQSQLNDLINNYFVYTSIDSKEYWHKITIINGRRYSKKHLLNSVITVIAPNTLMPVMYKEDGEDSCFLFQNGGNAVKSLASRGLFLPVTPDTSLPMNLQLEHCLFSDVPIDPSRLIELTVKKRTNLTERIVDLRNFINDPDLRQVYAPLWSPMVYITVVAALKKYLSRPYIILLSHNELNDSCGIIDAIKVFIVNLKGLDLRFNQFTWETFHKFPCLKITDLWLDGNPLSDSRKYSSAFIIREAKKVFPQLCRLEDIEISSTPVAHIIPLKNYITKQNYKEMVDHFLHHYFHLYESPARSCLSRLYHHAASLSISVCHTVNELPSCHSTNEYSKLSRNMLTVSDMTRMYGKLKKGPADISETLSNLPFVMFDPFSFQVDVPIATKTTVVINVCGVFKDFGSQNPGALFSFDRTFILTPWEAVLGEWRIINDIWAITNAPPAVAEASFTQAKKSLKSDFSVMIDNKVKDRDVLQRIVSNITKMNGVWTHKFLNDASWDLEMALQAFTDQFKADLIPYAAFYKSSNNIGLEKT